MDISALLIGLGGIFLVGLLADGIGKWFRLPRITLLLVCGAIVGKAGFNIFPAQLHEWYTFLSVVSLTMVAFLLGSTLTISGLKDHGTEITVISLAIVITTFVMVSLGLWAAGLNLALAMLMAAIAAATAPTSIRDVVQQSGRRDRFSDALLGIVAVDDVWGLFLFSLAIVAANLMTGDSSGGLMANIAYELGGSVLLGLVIGLPAAFLTGRLQESEPLMVEALALVFMTSGLALLLDLSFLIAGMTVGAVIVNRAKHHKRAFHQIERVQWPFLILFYILAGTTFLPADIVEIGLAGAVFMALRTLARILGGYAGAALVHRPKGQRWWYGISLLPQAGVAIGMALVAAQEFPQWEHIIMPLAIGPTILFELFGPVLTVIALRRAKPNDTLIQDDVNAP